MKRFCLFCVVIGVVFAVLMWRMSSSRPSVLPGMDEIARESRLSGSIAFSTAGLAEEAGTARSSKEAPARPERTSAAVPPEIGRTPPAQPSPDIDSLFSTAVVVDHERWEGETRREAWLLRVDLPWPWIRVCRRWRGPELIEETASLADGFILRRQNGADETALHDAAQKHGWSIEPLVPNFGLFRVHLAAATLNAVPAALAAAAHEPTIAFAEPDNLRFGCSTTPDDPRFGEQWALHNTGQTVPPMPGGTAGSADADIDAPEAWDHAQGTTSVVVASLDSGIHFAHEDLADNVWMNFGEMGVDDLGRDKRHNEKDDDANGKEDDWRGWNFALNNNNPGDDHGHGTLVAGIIAARGNNGKGIASPAWNAKLMALKFMVPGSGGRAVGTASGEVAAVEYAVRNGAFILNCSFTSSGLEVGNPGDSLVKIVYQAAVDAGRLVCAGSGNDGVRLDHSLRYPACYQLPALICVSATDHRDEPVISNFSTRFVNLAAPGWQILSTGRNGDYARSGGSSMACAVVASAAAFLKQLEPSLRADRIKHILEEFGDPIPGLADKTSTGRRLNLQAAAGAAFSSGGPFRPRVCGDGSTVLYQASNGTLWEWGMMLSGDSALAPVRISDLERVVSIALSAGQRAVVKSDGTVWRWGFYRASRFGELLVIPKPVQVPGLPPIRKITGTGDDYLTIFFCLAFDGSVWAWADGSSAMDNLGPAPPDPAIMPARPVPGATGIIDIASTNYGSIALLRQDGNLAVLPYFAKEPYLSELGLVTGVWAANNSIFALRADGKAFSSQIDIPTLDEGSLIPSPFSEMSALNPIVASSGSYIVQITGSTQETTVGETAFALLGDGRLLGYGPNGQGQLGLGHRQAIPAGTEVPDAGWRRPFAEVFFHHTGAEDGSAPAGTVLAIGRDNTLLSWGTNSRHTVDGLLGRGFGGIYRRIPYHSPLLKNIIDSSGDCAITSSGEVWVWGWHPLVQNHYLEKPTLIASLPGVRRVHMATWQLSSYLFRAVLLFIREDGTVWWMGNNRSVGIDPHTPVFSHVPAVTVPIPVPLYEYTGIQDFAATKPEEGVWFLSNDQKVVSGPTSFQAVMTTGQYQALNAGPAISAIHFVAARPSAFPNPGESTLLIHGADSNAYGLGPDVAVDPLGPFIPDGVEMDYPTPAPVLTLQRIRSLSPSMAVTSAGSLLKWVTWNPSGRKLIRQQAPTSVTGVTGLTAISEAGQNWMGLFGDSSVYAGDIAEMDGVHPFGASRHPAHYRIPGVFDALRVRCDTTGRIFLKNGNLLFYDFLGDIRNVPTGDGSRDIPGEIVVGKTSNDDGIFLGSLNFFDWIAEKSAPSNPRANAPEEDRDEDGMSNTAEYGLGTDPTSAGGSPLPSPYVEAFDDSRFGQDGSVALVSGKKYLAWEVPHPYRPDMAYVVEASKDLVLWGPATVVVETADYVKAYAPWPAEDLGNVYLRLRMTLK